MSEPFNAVRVFEDNPGMNIIDLMNLCYAKGAGKKRRCPDCERLAQAAEAFDALCQCYRVGKRPSEALFKKLDKAHEALAQHRRK